MATIDVKRITPLEWAGIGAGALAFIVSFFPWVSASVNGFGLGGANLASGSAWSAGFLAWFSVLLLLAAGVLVILPHFGTQVPNLGLIWLILSGVAVLFIILRWVTYSSNDILGISYGAGFGLFVGLILAVASGVAAFLTFQATRRTTTA